MFKVGEKARLTKTIDAAAVMQFAELSMDMNPVHTDREYARNSVFVDQVAHGMYISSFISAVLGTKIPGPGSLYLKQDIEFLKPVLINDTITAEVEVIELGKRGMMKLATRCFNQDGEMVIDGHALVKSYQQIN